MTQSPKVSIVIPVYNGSDYLDAAIQSALHQTYRNIEILVVNDGSDDGGATERIALKYGDKIRYFVKPNGGVATALNLAVGEMTGEYFSWLSHDDLYLPEKVEAQVKVLSAQGDLRTISFCDYSIFNSDPRNSISIEIKPGAPSGFRYWLTTNNVLHGCTLLIPRAAFEDCGTFATDLRTTQDYDLWFRMAESFRFFHLPHSLVLARSHPDQDSRKKAGIAQKECNQLLTTFCQRLHDGEIVGSGTPEVLPLRLADISASMFRRRFYRAGFATIPLAISRLRSKGRRSVIVYLISFPPKAVGSMLTFWLSALLRKVIR